VETKIFDQTQLNEAAAILAEGGLVAFPTGTVYGLGARARFCPRLLRKYIKSKGDLVTTL